MKRNPLFLALVPLAFPLSVAAFEFLLTRSQRAQKLVEEGQRHMLRGNYLQAVDSCTQALGVREDWSPAYLCRSEARLLAKDSAAAGSDARKAVNLDPRSGEPFRILGILEYQAGRYPQAVERFDRALHLAKLKPENVSDIYYYRASSRLNLGRYPDALKDVEQGLGVLRGVSGDYGDWSFYSLRAEIRRRLGQEARADDDERKVIRLVDERIARRPAERLELLRRRAESNALLRDFGSAIKDYDRLLSLDGKDVKALTDQANAYSLSGRHREAAAGLDRALSLDPLHLPALRLRAMERFALGDRAGAASDCERILRQDPGNRQALKLLQLAREKGKAKP